MGAYKGVVEGAAKGLFDGPFGGTSEGASWWERAVITTRLIVIANKYKSITISAHFSLIVHKKKQRHRVTPEFA